MQTGEPGAGFPAAASSAIAALAGVALATATPAWGQGAWPAKPVRFIVTYAASGPADIAARLMAGRLTEAWKQQVLVENRVGANGIIGAELVAHAAPDGYTHLLINTAFAINASLYPKLPYDVLRDFAYVSPLASGPAVLVVRPSLPVNNLAEFVAMAKAKPGTLSDGTTGIGSTGHLFRERLKAIGGIDLLHVPYKSQVDVHNDMLAGRIDFSLPSMSGTMPLVRSGKLRALAVTAAQRWPAAAEVPTVGEAGLPGFEQTNWYGVAAPAALSQALLQRINGDMVKMGQTAEYRERIGEFGVAPVSMNTTQFLAFVKSEIEYWGQLVKLSGAKPVD